MKLHDFIFKISLVISVFSVMQSCNLNSQNPEEYKSINSYHERPWTRWWWMGNAVTNEGITAELEAFKKVGIGGVEITPIYGVKGFEDQFISYLDSTWINRLKHTLDEADRLGLGVDINLGTGWPFGGPHIEPQHAAKRMEIHSFEVTKEVNSLDLLQNVDPKAKQVKIESVIAIKANRTEEVLSLTDQVNDNQIAINESLHDYQNIYVLVSMLTGQKVKRAAPGGEGLVVDHFDKSAVTQYLNRFDEVFNQNGLDPSRIRCFFNDSYEVYHANWTSDYLRYFEEMNNYDFGKYFYVLKDTSNAELSARVASDYRQSLENLLKKNFVEVLVNWCNEKGVKFRNQSHGSPANILDLYAAVDIPETETFRSSNFKIKGLKQDTFIFKDRPNSTILKFASSAANTSGKRLVSSETATWLDEHFVVSLNKIKPEVDHLFVNGVNHIFYHGTTYTPVQESWPGWLFYASTHVNPVNTWWNDLKALNDYIATCQHYLQKTEQDNDILIFWSAMAPYAENKTLRLQQFTIHSPSSVFGEDFFEITHQLQNEGYTYDYISDQQLLSTDVENGLITTKGGKYKAIIVPETKFIQEESLKKLEELNRRRVEVIFSNHLPTNFTGLSNRERSPENLLMEEKNFTVSNSIIETLNRLGINREPMADLDLLFIRKWQGSNRMYFVVNNSPNDINEWISINSKFKSIVLMDPLSQREGKAKTKGENQVFLQLKSGQSLFLFTHDTNVNKKDWLYYEVANEEYPITSSWEVQFNEGGPTLPEKRIVDHLESWDKFLKGDDRYFSGTATYTTQFKKPNRNTNNWLLKLDGVHESVQVVLNDRILDTLFSVPMEIIIPDRQLKDTNTLKLEISNLMANRIKYMDENDVEWKKFHEINFVNIHYKGFDASGWEFLPSGLMKPPVLIPLDDKKFIDLQSAK